MGLPELLEDPRYVNTVERSKHRDALIPTLQKAFLTRTYEEWEEILLANDIPMGAINNLAQVVEHPQVKARASFQDVDHPSVGNVRVVRSPVRLSKTPARKPTPSPVHGQHTREVLKEVLGLPDGEIDRLVAAGVVGVPRAPLKGGA
jgi:crotonobetainyl-CoA:carnitine CoA-transferase CaiB-like acyl-CoA transferase